jgi:hypothetical protein
MIIKRRGNRVSRSGKRLGRFDAEPGARTIAGIAKYPTEDPSTAWDFQPDPNPISSNGFNLAGLFAKGADKGHGIAGL